MTTFAEKAITFHKNLNFDLPLPEEIQIMNPYKNNTEILKTLEAFHHKFFGDQYKRQLVLGINPGRLGAGATGISFTDTKRLREVCGINNIDFDTHEPSSVFIYKMINAYGGPKQFYKHYYLNCVFPLGFLQQNKKGNWVNCNYYDYNYLFDMVKPYIISSLKKQIEFGVDTSKCYSLGKKNAVFLDKINKEEHLFDQIIALPHPRYIVQYKNKEMAAYTDVYLKALQEK